VRLGAAEQDNPVRMLDKDPLRMIWAHFDALRRLAADSISPQNLALAAALACNGQYNIPQREENSMRLQDGKVIVDDLENQGIKLLTGEAVPETGMAPRELNDRILSGLAKGRAERPEHDLVWDIMEGMLSDINRLVALQ